MEFFNSDHGISSKNSHLDFGFDQGFTWNVNNKVAPSSSTENERVELATANLVKPSGQRSAADKDKALIALRNHSEAERRRRERNNAHLATLRTLIPGSTKMEKAALLAEVVKRVKELMNNMIEATKGTLVPTGVDEVKVKVEEETNPNNGNSSSSLSVRASLCCESDHELLSDLRKELQTLNLKMESAEIATFENRMIFNVIMILDTEGDDHQQGDEDQGRTVVLGDCVQQSLRSVLDKFYASEEYSLRNSISGKRRRALTFFDPLSRQSSSSGSGTIW